MGEFGVGWTSMLSFQFIELKRLELIGNPRDRLPRIASAMLRLKIRPMMSGSRTFLKASEEAEFVHSVSKSGMLSGSSSASGSFRSLGMRSEDIDVYQALTSRRGSASYANRRWCSFLFWEVVSVLLQSLAHCGSMRFKQ